LGIFHGPTAISTQPQHLATSLKRNFGKTQSNCCKSYYDFVHL